MTPEAARDASKPPPVALTIAGSDSSGGAGIQADLKTFTVHGVYGASVVTALTAQNTQGVHGVHTVPAGFVGQQIDAVLTDLDVGAVKTGMLANAGIIQAVADRLSAGFAGQLVVDPVMIATSGDRLIDPAAVEVLTSRLLPMALLITPNLAEAAVLCGSGEARSLEEMEDQGRRLLGIGAAGVLIKGGHGDGSEAVDVLVSEAGIRHFSSSRIETLHTHGSGCTLSAAITANLALGMELEQAIFKAKGFVAAAIESAARRPVGRGRAPLDHLVGYCG
ncbi:MAG: bifunctional hydroxymethylpyrimidine kinase/phosphomethylpyrimidine kinase [Alphaproteobacteria bacterium]|nr:bifunctional hydroxymethylpyrimidine kinase/phosphomethylpyrimidine kinase [Alphaproteobacteria bacterium]